MKRLPLNKDLTQNQIKLSEDQTHYLTRVLRLSEGSEVVGFDGQGYQRCFALAYENYQWILIGKGDLKQGQSRFPIGLCYGIPKGEKLDLVVRQLTELGVHTLDLFQAKRSVSIWKKEKVKSKLNRLNKVIEQAARQSHQTTLLTLSPPQPLHQMIQRYQSIPLKLYLDPTASSGWPTSSDLDYTPSMTNLIQDSSRSHNELHCMLLVGPEGGLDPQEIELLNANGWQGIRLNTPILRTETAAIVACSLALDRLGFMI